MKYRMTYSIVIVDGDFVMRKYRVQKKIWFVWFTVKSFFDEVYEDWAYRQAKELLDLLNERL